MLLPELTAHLIQADKNVLVADTCLLFDVIRDPARNKMHPLEFGLRIDKEMQAGILPFCYAQHLNTRIPEYLNTR